MFKFTCLAWCVVAVSLSNVCAEYEGEKGFFILVEECAKLHGHTMMELNSAMQKADVSKIEPCFWGCAFTKTGFLNEKGQYDLESGLISLKRFMRDPVGLERLEQVARNCESVKDKAVSDGEAGCERGTLAAKCFMEKLELMRS